MKYLSIVLCALLCVPVLGQAARPAAVQPRAATASKVVPPFSGSWVYDAKRSVVTERIPGISSAVISYDGKTWQYTHRHQSSSDTEPEAWQISLTVDSPKYQVQRGEELAFRSRITRQGKDLLLDQYGSTTRGEKFHNTTRYTLSENGNTLTETETSTSRLGKTKNVYVLVREGTGQATQ